MNEEMRSVDLSRKLVAVKGEGAFDVKLVSLGDPESPKTSYMPKKSLHVSYKLATADLSSFHVSWIGHSACVMHSRSKADNCQENKDV